MSRTLTIGHGGIKVVENKPFGIYENAYQDSIGILTSIDNVLSIKFTQASRGISMLHATIADHVSHKVGLDIIGEGSGNRSQIEIGGNRANTFSGLLTISGNTAVRLNKPNGVTAVAGNILVNKAGHLYIDSSNQISDGATIKLSSIDKNNRSLLGFSHKNKSIISEKIRTLRVDVAGQLDFDRNALFSTKTYLYLDDLVINPGSDLVITNWIDKRDYLFVRKDSAHLEDSLKRITFKDYNPSNIHLEEYDGNYWAISAAPEPEAYGALVAAGVLGATLAKRRTATRRRTARARYRESSTE